MKMLHKLGGKVILHIFKAKRKLFLLTTFALKFHISLQF